jgi:hypothetical protein
LSKEYANTAPAINSLFRLQFPMRAVSGADPRMQPWLTSTREAQTMLLARETYTALAETACRRLQERVQGFSLHFRGGQDRNPHFLPALGFPFSVAAQ